jgi:hypothetical protein
MPRIIDKLFGTPEERNARRLERQRAELSGYIAKEVAEAIFDYGIDPLKIALRAERLFDAAYDPKDRSKLSVYMDGGFYYGAAHLAKKDFDVGNAGLRTIAIKASPLDFCRAIENRYSNTASSITRRMGAPYRDAARALIKEKTSLRAALRSTSEPVNGAAQKEVAANHPRRRITKNNIPPEIQALADRMAAHVFSTKVEYRYMLGEGNVYDLRVVLNETNSSGPSQTAKPYHEDLRSHLDAMGAQVKEAFYGGIFKPPAAGTRDPSSIIITTSFKDGALLKAFKKAITKAKDASHATSSSRAPATAPAL